jgi:hypothetical protein
MAVGRLCDSETVAAGVLLPPQKVTSKLTYHISRLTRGLPEEGV